MTSVWPALWPPWKRTTMSAFSESQSTILPLPSSPHWEPTTTTFDIDYPLPALQAPTSALGRPPIPGPLPRIKDDPFSGKAGGAFSCARGPEQIADFTALFQWLARHVSAAEGGLKQTRPAFGA